jgi:hypothetical protein
LSDNKNKTNSDVIKNPLRTVRMVQQPYTPEYQRLNREPILQERLQDPFSIDGELCVEDQDHTSLSNSHIIDNNDYVDFPAAPVEDDITNEAVSKKENESSTPKPGDFILMVQGKTILISNQSIIEQKVKEIVYGEDDNFDINITLDDIVVLKRLALKVGIFIQNDE